jgi:flagellar biosynthesis/type III secretory pathway chaperone
MSREREAEAPTPRALLEAERACCARLARLLEAERAAAAAYDHPALLACLKEREALHADWRRLAGERRERLGAGAGSVAALAARDPELAATAAALDREAAQVRRAQRVNEAIVRAMLAHVTDLLAVIQRQLPESRYDGRAAITAPLAEMRGAGWSA